MKLSDVKLGETMTPQDRHAELTREIVAARNAGDFDKAEALNEQRRCAEIDIDEQCIEERSERPVHWNTGRKYGAEGQRISAVQIGETVFFKDHDRMIVGKYVAAMPEDRTQLRDRVMGVYDMNNYSMAVVVPECIQDYPTCEECGL